MAKIRRSFFIVPFSLSCKIENFTVFIFFHAWKKFNINIMHVQFNPYPLHYTHTNPRQLQWVQELPCKRERQKSSLVQGNVLIFWLQILELLLFDMGVM